MPNVFNPDRATNYLSGYADGPGKAKYPFLWNGLQGLWCVPIGTQGQQGVKDFCLTPNLGAYGGAAIPFWDGSLTGIKAVNFPGVTGYVEIPTRPRYDNGQGTISLWFKVRNMPAGNGDCIIARSNSNGSDGLNIQVTGGVVNAQLHPQFGHSVTVDISSPAISAGVWYHIAFAFNMANAGVSSLYLNGLSVGTGTAAELHTFAANPIRLADATDTFWEIFDGWLHSVCWYSRMLAPEEVWQLSLGDLPITLARQRSLLGSFTSPPPATVYQRSTLSQLGTRVGTRQVMRA